MSINGISLNIFRGGDYLMEWINSLIGYANEHGVNPIIFLVIYFGSTPFLLIPIFYLAKMVKNKASRSSGKFISLVSIVSAAWLAPYLYVLICGRGINPIIIVIILIFAVFTLIRYLKKKLRPK